ncbi:MAG TPA: phosphate signaling complex protein PhoU [Candidatus Altiarchaeales archaeon]|nr:phosphate signaling complex protein PhoU [Candidatus Altiarchaeales archaeon]
MARRQLDEQIERIKEDIKEMTDFVSDQLKDSLKALSHLDKKLSDNIMTKDKIANEFYTDIKERCIQTIALQQPVAKDLRFISISMDVASNLERVGDYAVDIAKTVGYILKEPPRVSSRFTKEFLTLLEPINDEKAIILEMSKIAVDMVEKSGYSFINADEKYIRNILDREDKIDEMFGEVFRKLEDMSRRDQQKVHFAMNLILIARHLERVADHAVNITNRTIYAIKGREEYI